MSPIVLQDAMRLLHLNTIQYLERFSGALVGKVYISNTRKYAH